jgi:hypothetical protein
VGAEFVVEVPHVGPNRVHRDIKLAGDLRRGKAGLQEAQDAGLGLAERLGQPLWRARSGRGRRAAAQHDDDLARQWGVRSALPGMAFKQLRYRPVRTPTPPTSARRCWPGPAQLRPLRRDTGDDDLVFIETFRSDHYEEVSLANWLSHLPPKLLSAHLNIPEETLATFPRGGQGIVPLP